MQVVGAYARPDPSLLRGRDKTRQHKDKTRQDKPVSRSWAVSGLVQYLLCASASAGLLRHGTVGWTEPGVAWMVRIVMGCHGPGVEEASEKWMDDASDDDGNHGMSINGRG